MWFSTPPVLLRAAGCSCLRQGVVVFILISQIKCSALSWVCLASPRAKETNLYCFSQQCIGMYVFFWVGQKQDALWGWIRFCTYPKEVRNTEISTFIYVGRSLVYCCYPQTSIWQLCGQNLLLMMHLRCHLLSNSDTDSKGLLSLICIISGFGKWLHCELAPVRVIPFLEKFIVCA